MKSNRLPLVTSLALFTAVTAGCGVGQAGVPDAVEVTATTALPVLTVGPETADIHATYRTTTTIASDAEAPILARVAGEVVEILVEEGDMVREGQILARLDGDRLRLEMLQAKATLEKTEREYDRLTSLHERGLVSGTMFDGLKYDLEALRAGYELKRLNYDYTSIRATIAGVVSSRDIKVGTNIAAGGQAFRVTDTARLVAYLNIPQTELHKFAAGHEATVTVDSMPDVDFPATVARISPTIDARSGTFRATAYIDNPAGDLAPGMFGRFTIAYEKHSNAMVIPASAAVQEDNETVVYVVRDGAAVRQPIRTGILSDGLLEVLGGLDADARIVITGQSGLRDGSRVLASSVVPGSTNG